MRSFFILALAVAQVALGNPVTQTNSKKISKDGNCGGARGSTCLGSKFGNCCSGKTDAYCGTGCQPGFGDCASVSSSQVVSSSLSASSSSPTSPPSSSSSIETSTSSSIETPTSSSIETPTPTSTPESTATPTASTSATSTIASTSTVPALQVPLRQNLTLLVSCADQSPYRTTSLLFAPITVRDTSIGHAIPIPDSHSPDRVDQFDSKYRPSPTELLVSQRLEVARELVFLSARNHLVFVGDSVNYCLPKPPEDQGRSCATPDIHYLEVIATYERNELIDQYAGPIMSHKNERVRHARVTNKQKGILHKILGRL
ncbi:FAD-binding domain-containing protein [Stemphylium lycopersici]|uniref:FAD-binding domain-containing protein n=1 Tax=Stemphylium lycopersici TaxID=183478 RepID=A0A364MUZ5_STELY|nr:carbohydrate-binding module family 18 [Stemphylium lycopersici]RAR01761.1 FAD-binding domain-containing protein [Stemphylium lycopersici]RAR04420.1 FAD-binding domain-containing protein [Stemphylium lycopersici]